MQSHPRPIRVLVVDDSPFYQKLLAEVLHSSPDFEIIGYASDPLEAREKIKQLHPDVLTLDIEMPKMDGLSFLEKIMTLRPMPVVMVSTLTEKGTEATIRALETGAVDCVAKPAGTGTGTTANFDAFAMELITKLRQAAHARPRSRSTPPPVSRPRTPHTRTTVDVIAVGASTGGVEATREILAALPDTLPPIVIVQHMPEHFTASYARRLDTLCAAHITEARHGQTLESGHVYIAPGNRHLRLRRSGAQYQCFLSDEDKVSGHRPSVDVFFHSVASSAGKRATGLILTGMGRDGAEGLLAMRTSGAITLGESESTCVVYGMPKAAQDMGAVCVEKPLHLLATTLCDVLNGEALC